MGTRNAEVGRVVSNKMDKTVVVVVERQSVHRLYKKAVRRLKRFKAHDERNTCQIGDMVRIVETRPMSKDKRWRVAEIIVGGFGAELAPSTEKEVRALQDELTPEITAETEASVAEGDAPEDDAAGETDSDADAETEDEEESTEDDAGGETDSNADTEAEDEEEPAEDASSDADAEEKEESS